MMPLGSAGFMYDTTKYCNNKYTGFGPCGFTEDCSGSYFWYFIFWYSLFHHSVFS